MRVDRGTTCPGLCAVRISSRCWHERCHPLPATLSPFAPFASALLHTMVCWGGCMSKKGTRSRVDNLIRRAGSVVGLKLDSLVTWQRRGQ
ncbi:hypothetical protein ILYODFUR_001623 [Ilyodon furcidens]|uniref:Uncharacterized protein n=1 Tax=Ilyodon furcidens TaxID=33524 RepID=A0ABV0U5Q1_9TELE